jgi:hypothetical protein
MNVQVKRVNLINITFDSENEIGQIRNHIPFSMCLVHAPTHVNIDVKDCVISGKDEPYLDSIVSDRESLQKHVNNWRFDTNGQNEELVNIKKRNCMLLLLLSNTQRQSCFSSPSTPPCKESSIGS